MKKCANHIKVRKALFSLDSAFLFGRWYHNVKSFKGGNRKMGNKQKKKEGLHPFVIIVVILLLAAVAAQLLPAGAYDRVAGPDGRTVVDPNTFHTVARTGFNIVGVMTAIPRGIEEAANVIVITLMIGGAFGVIKKTGMLEIGVQSLVKAFSKSKLSIIFVLYAVFALITGFIGVPELALVYILVLMPLMFSLGFDSMVTVGISLCGTAAGFSAAWSAPATVGLGHQLAELPMYSGMSVRVLTVAILAVTAAIYTVVYARKVLNNPQSSLVYEDDIPKRKECESSSESTVLYPRVKLAGAITILMFFGLIAGVLISAWGFEEMAGYFIIMGVIAGLAAGMSLRGVCDSFEAGLKEMLVGALICGIARGISVVLSDASVMDTIIMYLSKIVVFLPAQVASVGMFIITTLFNAIIASGSGKAVIALPIMLPLADIASVSRQTTILAYQLGDGITNILWPASGYFMAALAIGKISYTKWVKWFLPLLIIWLLAASMIVALASMMNYGPF